MSSEMTVNVVCRKCAAKIRAKAALAGKRVKCPKCGAGLEIPAAAQGANPSAKAAQPPPKVSKTPAKPGNPSAAQPSIGGFLDDEMSDCRPPTPPSSGGSADDGSYGVSLPATPASIPGAERESAGVPMLSGRLAPASDESLRSQVKEAVRENMMKWAATGSTVLVVGGGILWAALWFWGKVSDLEIENVIGAHDISDGIEIPGKASWLKLNTARLPKYVDKFQKQASMKESPADGMWSYTIKTQNGQTLEYSKATITTIDKKPVRELKDLKSGFFNALQEMGYFREPSKRPPPLKIDEFTIREPLGRTWTLAKQNNASLQMCNLTSMVGFAAKEADLSPLLKARRGTLAYAVFFGGMDAAMPLDWKIEKSCDSDKTVRTFAAEMLLSTFPYLPTEGKKVENLDPKKYEDLLTQLAQASSVADKKKLYEQLRDQTVAP